MDPKRRVRKAVHPGAGQAVERELVARCQQYGLLRTVRVAQTRFLCR